MPEDSASRSLIVGNRIRCPKDRKLRNMFAYRHFEIMPEYADELNVVLKCPPPCGHIFSPGMSNEELRAHLQEVAGVC